MQWLYSSKGIMVEGSERRWEKKKKKNLSKNARVPWRGIRAEFTAHSIHPGLLLVISALFHAGELSVYELCVHVSPILTNTQRFEC